MSGDEYLAWQRAATDYWVSRHPELGRYRRGDPARTPTVAEIRDRAQALHSAEALIGNEVSRSERKLGFRHPPSTAWFHETLAALYEPVDRAIDQLKSGDAAGIETAVRFLEADVYCHRSGYTKQRVIHVLTRHELSQSVVDRLRGVVLNFVDTYDRREQRSYIRLARRVDSDQLRRELRTRAASDDPKVGRRARWVLEGLERLEDVTKGVPR